MFRTPEEKSHASCSYVLVTTNVGEAGRDIFAGGEMLFDVSAEYAMYDSSEHRVYVGTMLEE